MIIEAQFYEYVFFWSDGPPPPPERDDGTFWETAEVGFGSPQQAVMFLRRFPVVYECRALLNEKFPGQNSRLTVDAIHGKLADLMAKRRLRVLKRWKRATGYVQGSNDATKVPRKEVTEPAEAKEPATFLSNHDGGAQAAALSEAASDGEAFCEECEKARQQQAGPAAAPPPADDAKASFNDDHDGDAQAAALTEASKQGVPFCEECEKANQAAAA